MDFLQVRVKRYKDCEVPDISEDDEHYPLILPNEIPLLRAVPPQFWILCKKILDKKGASCARCFFLLCGVGQATSGHS